MVRPIRCCILTAAVLAAGCVAPGDEAPHNDPAKSQCADCNVILITIDTLRADHLSVYGYDRETTPRLDAFGESGIVFERAIAQSCWTAPSLLSMMTSKYFSRMNRDQAANEYEDLRLAEVFSKNGYATAAFVAHPALARAHVRGFDLYDDSEAKENDGSSSEGLTNAAIRWLEDVGDRQFFLWVHYFDPHAQYLPPPPYDGLFAGGYEGGLRKGLHMGRLRQHFRQKKLSDADVDFVVSLYDGEISFTDMHIGRLLDALDSADREGNIVVVAADHGEEFGERNTVGQHRTSVYREQVHTPLMLRFPGARPTRASYWVPNLDIAPTLVELAGIEVPPGFEGRHLLDRERGPILTECDYVERDGQARHPKKIAALYDGDLKVMHHFQEGWTRVFDSSKDPDETHDLSQDRPETRADHRARLLEMALSDERSRQYYGDIDAPMIDEETKKRLESLGYVM